MGAFAASSFPKNLNLEKDFWGGGGSGFESADPSVFYTTNFTQRLLHKKLLWLTTVSAGQQAAITARTPYCFQSRCFQGCSLGRMDRPNTYAVGALVQLMSNLKPYGLKCSMNIVWGLLRGVVSCGGLWKSTAGCESFFKGCKRLIGCFEGCRGC